MYTLEHIVHKRTLHIKIKDEKGREIYDIKDNSGLFSKTAYIKNCGGQEVAKVCQIPGVTPTSRVSCKTGAEFKVVQAFSMKPVFRVQGSDYKITGHIYNTNYVITKQSKEILRCRKECENGKTVKRIEIYQKDYEIEGIAIVTAIEAAQRNLFISGK